VQKKRLIKLGSSAATRWRVTKGDWARHKRYDAYRTACERALRETSTGDAPWTVIDAADAHFRDVSTASAVLERIRQNLAIPVKHVRHHPASADQPNPVTILDSLDLTKKISDADYRKELERWQREMHGLGQKVQKKARGVIMVFEGWDASGKGGAIRRVTQALDARQYQVIPISAPTEEELSRHYLWRFWRHVGRTGRFTFYDRSWYGRVLVERIEGLVSVATWQRAYKEINDFEQQLVDDGIILLKFWLHISRAEQLRRFKARARDLWKNYKITDEDYRNRTLTNAYEAAASDMIGRTSTEYAPWILVEAEDKHFARIKVLREAAQGIAARL
jgi:polyphosphate kinase 2 (PPK2 family)